MDGLRYWAFGICSAAIACGLARMILPQSGMQKIFQITSSVFFLSCLLSPLAFMPIEIELETPEQLMQEAESRAERITAQAQEQQGALAVESVRLQAGEILEGMGIGEYQIYINTHEKDGESIVISECEVYLDESYAPRHDEIREALMQQLGVNVLIGYG